MAGMALTALGWLWRRTWSRFALCVACVPLVWGGSHGTSALGWLWWRAWSALVAQGAAARCVAGAGLGDVHVSFMWQAALGDIPAAFAWQPWHLLTSTLLLRGMRGKWHLWHSAGSGGALGRCGATALSHGRCGTVRGCPRVVCCLLTCCLLARSLGSGSAWLQVFAPHHFGLRALARFSLSRAKMPACRQSHIGYVVEVWCSCCHPWVWMKPHKGRHGRTFVPISMSFLFSPHLCVEFLFWFCILSPAVRRHRLLRVTRITLLCHTHTLLFHTLLFHTLLFHTQNCHTTLLHTSLSHTTLSHTQLCHTHTTLSHIYLTHIYLTHNFHTPLLLTYSLINHRHTTLSHIYLIHTLDKNWIIGVIRRELNPVKPWPLFYFMLY